MLNTKAEFALHIALPPVTSDEVLQGYVHNATQCVVDAMGMNLPHTVVAASSYNMHALVSTKYQEGRCFLAGDSAQIRRLFFSAMAERISCFQPIYPLPTQSCGGKVLQCPVLTGD